MKEEKIWFLIMTVCGIIFITLLSLSLYNIRFKYGLLIVILFFIVTCIGLIMTALTRYIPTREIISILIKKVREW